MENDLTAADVTAAISELESVKNMLPAESVILACDIAILALESQFRIHDRFEYYVNKKASDVLIDALGVAAVLRSVCIFDAPIELKTKGGKNEENRK